MKLLALLSTLLFLFSGCSGEPDSAEEAAISMCKAAKEIDINDMKALTDIALHKHLDQQYQLFVSLPQEQKDMLLQKLQSSPHCEVASTKLLENNTSLIELKNMGHYKVKKIQELWRITQF